MHKDLYAAMLQELLKFVGLSDRRIQPSNQYVIPRERSDRGNLPVETLRRQVFISCSPRKKRTKESGIGEALKRR